MFTKILRCKILGHKYELTQKHHFQINEYRRIIYTNIIIVLLASIKLFENT